jgi:hypothetical protein
MGRGGRRGGDMWVWICWIKLSMVGVTYFMAKCVRLTCVGLDIVEDLVKAVDVFDKSISGGGGGKAELLFKNGRCKERMRKLCVFRDGIYLSRFVNFVPACTVFLYASPKQTLGWLWQMSVQEFRMKKAWLVIDTVVTLAWGGGIATWNLSWPAVETVYLPNIRKTFGQYSTTFKLRVYCVAVLLNRRFTDCCRSWLILRWFRYN